MEDKKPAAMTQYSLPDSIASSQTDVLPQEKPPWWAFFWDYEPGRTKEEKEFVRPLDMFLLTLLCLGYFIKNLDQTNIANAHVCIFHASSAAASMFSGYLQAGLYKGLNGVNGLAGWQSLDAEERAIVLGLMHAGGYAVNAWLPYLTYPASDAPVFRKGFAFTIGVFVALVGVVGGGIWSMYRREAREKGEDDETILQE